MNCKFCRSDMGDSPRCPNCGHAPSDNILSKYLPKNFGTNLAFCIGLIVAAVFFSFRKSVIVTLFNEQSAPLAPKKITDATYDYTQGLLSSLVIFFAVAAVIMAALIVLSIVLKRFKGDAFPLEHKVLAFTYGAQGEHGNFVSSYSYAPLTHIFLFIEIVGISLSSVVLGCMSEGMNDFPLCRFLNTAMYTGTPESAEYDWSPLFRWIILLLSIAMVFTVICLLLNLSLGYTAYEDRIVGRGASVKFIPDFINCHFLTSKKDRVAVKRFRQFDFTYDAVTSASAHGRSVVLTVEKTMIRVVAKNAFEASKLVKYINEKKENKDAEFFKEKEPLFSI